MARTKNGTGVPGIEPGYMVRLGDLVAEKLPQDLQLTYHVARPVLTPLLDQLEQTQHGKLAGVVLQSGIGYLERLAQVEREQERVNQELARMAALAQEEERLRSQTERERVGVREGSPAPGTRTFRG